MTTVEELYKGHQKDVYPPVDTEKHVASKEQRYVIGLLSQYSRVLDIGCGNGSFLLSLSRTGHECFGVDVSEPMVEYTTSLGLEARKLNVETEPLPADLGQFDAITMFQVLEHLYDPQEVLIRNVIPRLRPGGRFVCAVPNSVYLKYRLMVLMGRIPSFGAIENGKWKRPYNLTHKTLFTFQGIRTTLEIAGLTNITMKGSTGSASGTLRDIIKRMVGIPSLTCASILAVGDMTAS